MTPQDTMRLALEALEIVKLHFTQNRHVKEAIEALRSALAQQDELGNASKAEQLLASHDHSLRAEFGRMKAALAQQGEQQCDTARVLEWMRTPNRKAAQFAFTEGLERQAAYWVEIAQGEPLRAQPLTCDTCKFSEADKDNPAIRIYEETCFWCSQYYANHYEAHGIGVQK